MSKSISHIAISKAEIEAATKVLQSKQKLPSFELPTFHFYDKSMEITENMDKLPLAGHDFHTKSDKELHEIRQNVETVLHYRMHGGKKINEANMGGPMFTWNKDSKALHNPDPHNYSKVAVDKEIKKDKRIGGKEARKIHAVLKGWRGK